MKAIKLSVVIITLNEEENIGRCLDSVSAIADEMLVVDSFSTDATLEIAKSKGARIIQNAFQGFIEQRRFCIEQCQFEHVLALDADEWLSRELKEEIAFLKSNWSHDAYYLNRLSKISDKWIKHGSWYPAYKLRLFERKYIVNTGTNPHEVIAPLKETTTKKLKGHLFHLAFENIHEHYLSTSRYSSTAAHDLFKQRKKPRWMAIIFKPALRFISEYFIKLGLLDGFYGFVIAKNAAHYVFQRETRLMELHRQKKS